MNIVVGVCFVLSMWMLPIPIAVGTNKASWGVFNPTHLLWVVFTSCWALPLMLGMVGN